MYTQTEYENAVARIGDLMDAEANTPECDELENLAILVVEYENKHYPLPEPTEEDIKQHNKEQRGG